ncbi:heavy-metal-associated domain-containing protein [Sphingomicrobium astaxanthinifaciens]|uniref:heavy-metal-associated domain-containing protein n=1 Tax=Sphingomicrobium astaxanthinifaciens TaxID=1227949 RepID=UPI001FCBF6D9|nr:heavy-metal-associated domain-containing protein [Sphingomicrobium astaxanthinifaciens]MCJ7422223.1 heavy-metal-associated domain-containing protein [Sphingomicrobium astaxanthinifaciens]
MPFPRVFLLIVPLLLLGGYAAAQMEDGDRGILPRDTEQVLEVTGIAVDVAGEDAQDARFNGWRIAQREGWRRLWAQTTGRPAREAPRLSDATLDELVGAVVVEREQIGPTRYIATLAIQFDRARTGERLGLSGSQRRSAPMLLIPVTVTAGTVTTVETRNPWQRAWALFRTGDSPIDYVRVSGLGVDPLLVNAAATRRPGAEWWANVADLYGASNILIAEVTLHRLYPGGPAEGRFVARVGRDRTPLGSFTLRVASSEAIPAMMNQAAARIDRMFARAFREGTLRPDRALVIEAAPPPVVAEETVAPVSTYQMRIYAGSGEDLRAALGALRGTAGVEGVTEQSLAAGAISNVLVTYRGDVDALRASLLARGWYSTYVAGVLQIQRQAISRPAPSPEPAPAPTPAPAEAEGDDG